MVELNDIAGVGPSRAEDLEELGYESVEDVANADPEDLEELSRVGEDKALEMVVDAQNLVEGAESEESEQSEEEDSITFDEEPEEDAEPELDPDPELEEDETESEDEPAEPYSVSLDLSAEERDVLVAATLDSHTNLRSSRRARSQACLSFLEKLREGSDLELTEDELNAVHAALRQRRLDYQGNNHMDLMHTAMNVEEQIADARQEHLF